MAFVSNVKLPPFIMKDPQLWFAMCESTFALGVPNPITDSDLKFSHIVLNLPQEASAMVRDLIIYPDETDPYTAIKNQLIQRINPSLSPHQTLSAPQKPRPANLETAIPLRLEPPTSIQHTQAYMSPQCKSIFPSRYLAPTLTEVSVPSPQTQESVLQSSTSQRSSHSPSATHLTSPSQGQSPGISSSPSSLQQLEQTAIPRVTTGPSTTPTASSVASLSVSHSAGEIHNTDVGGNQYGHSNAHLSKQDQMHFPPVTDNIPPPQSPDVLHISQQNPHLNQSHSVDQLPSSIVSSVLNSQPIQQSDISEVSTLSTSSLLPEGCILVKSSQHSLVPYGSNNSSSTPIVSARLQSSSILSNVGYDHHSAPKSELMRTLSLQVQLGLTPAPSEKTFSYNPPKLKPPKPPKPKRNKLFQELSMKDK